MNENVAKRLAFIRYLYDEAVRQSQNAEPTCSTSVLTFHAATELFLVLACEHKDVGKKSMEFMAHWEELKRKVPEGLTYRMLDFYHQRNPLISGLRWPMMSPTPAGYKNGGPVLSRSRSGENDKDGYARKKIGEILEQTDALKKAVNPMRDAMVAVALDVDYKRYQRFLELTPEVKVMNAPDDPWAKPVPTPLYRFDWQRYADEGSYRFCFDFVVEAILRAQTT